MLLLLSELSPSQVARYLSDNFGHAVGASVVVKWDNLILRKGRSKEGSRRMYDQLDIVLFNGIAIMRNLGYSIDQIRQVFDLNLREDWNEQECSAFIDSIKMKIAKQRKGLGLYDTFFDALKKKRSRSVVSGSRQTKLS